MEKIIKRNFEYYKNHVLGKYYVFTANKNESIIVKTSPENLAHLLGIKYATQNGLFRYSGTRFFREMQVYKNGVPPFVGIYDLIDAEKDKKDIYIKHTNFNKPKTIIEKDNLNQSKLSIGCKLKDLTDFERKYVINIYNMILGGGFNSKFMQEIREKNSLAYYINSSLMKADNLLLIQSGISSNNFKKVITSVKKIMKEMTKGNISLEELEKLTNYAENIGLAFQIKDDILSVEGNELITGKPVGNDEARGKCTYVSKYGLEEAKKILNDITKEAIQNLEEFGEKAEFLKGLAEFIKTRNK